MADLSVNMLPKSNGLTDDGLLVVYQNNQAQSIEGQLIKEFAKEGVEVYVSDAQNAATQAAQAAKDAQVAAEKAAYVNEKAEAAAQAALAAQEAKEAAETARQAAEQAAALAAEQAVSDAENRLQGYVADAEAAKDAAAQAKANAENAASGAAQSTEEKLKGYVADAEKAKVGAESAAETAAEETSALVDKQMAQYVADAQAAQKAAEQAKNEAQAIAGGEFLTLSGGTMRGPITLSGDPTEDLHAVPKQYLDGAIGYVEAELAAVNGGSSDTGDGTGSGESGGSGGVSYEIGHGLKVKDGTLMVNSVSNFEGDNSLPATASLVQTTVGNIEILLAVI